jgi:sigma-E factor negative regulatory protein RseC
MQLFGKNKQSTNIKHVGAVIKIAPTQIEVSIISALACSSCHAGSFCAAFGQKEKNIIVANTGQPLNIGDKVNVILKQSLGSLAVMLAYVIPVFVVITSIVILSSVGLADALSGLFSLLILCAYFMVLYLFRGKLKKIYNFYIEKIE